jgi:lysozyme
MNRKLIFDAAKAAGADFNQPGAVDRMDAAINQALTEALGLPTLVAASVALPPRVGLTGHQASDAAVELLHSFEQCRLTTYPDPGSKNGLPITGGWGTTRDHNGKPFKLGFTADQAYWDRLFIRDLAEVEAGVNRLLGNAPTTQNQFDALVCIAYNIGLDEDEDTKAEGLGDSTLLRLHLQGNFAGAADAFKSWRFNDGKEMKGLVARRNAEAKLYRGG